jgi:hypothetical protein
VATEKIPVAGLTEEEQRIWRRLQDYLGAASVQFNLTPEIDADALTACRKSCNVPATERVLGLMDFTGNQDGDNVLLFGCQGIYFTNPKKGSQPGPGALPYSEFPRCVFVNHGKELYLGNERYLYFDPDETSVNFEEVANLLHALREIVQERGRRSDLDRDGPPPNAGGQPAGAQAEETAPPQPAAEGQPAGARAKETEEKVEGKDRGADFSPVVQKIRAFVRLAEELSDKPRKIHRVTKKIRRCLVDAQDYLDVAVIPEIDAETLSQCRKQCQVPASERILGLLDFTGNESGDNVLLFGSHGIYFHNYKDSPQPGPGTIPYTEFPRHTFVNHGTVVYLGNDRSLYFDPDAGVDCEQVASLLHALREIVQERGWRPE